MFGWDGRGEKGGGEPEVPFGEEVVPEAAGEDGEGEKIFEVVRLGALSKQKDGRQKFEIECSRRMEEE